MDTDPYRYHDQRYYTSDADNNAAEPATDQTPQEARAEGHKPLSKSMLWSLAAAGGIAAISMMWASKRHKNRRVPAAA